MNAICAVWCVIAIGDSGKEEPVGTGYAAPAATASEFSSGSAEHGGPAEAPGSQRLGVASPGSSDHTGKWVGGKPFFLQERACGLNAVYLLAELNGCDIEYETLREELPLAERGSNLGDMAAVLQKHGLNARAVKGTPALLSSTMLPLIVHTEPIDASLGHYFVVLRCDGPYITVQDPTSLSVDIIERGSFLELWSGNALLIEHARDDAGVWSVRGMVEGVLYLILVALVFGAVWQCGELLRDIRSARRGSC